SLRTEPAETRCRAGIHHRRAPFTLEQAGCVQLQMVTPCLLEGEGGTALVDPGPASALDMLRAKLGQRGLSVADVDHLVLTHIHLDHAGATGTLVRENPRIRVWVHERGAPHLIDPARLIESATRLYGAK